MIQPCLEVVLAVGLSVPLFARCYFLLRENPPEFARPATFFLCWCKERRQRKHLKTHLVSSQSACSTNGAKATTRLAAQTVPPGCMADTPPRCCPDVSAWHGRIHAETCGRHRRWSVRGLHRGNCLSRKASCRPGTAVWERCPCHRSVKWVLRCFLCLLSLHQQRKEVAGRANSGGLSQSKREHRANSGTAKTLKWPGQ